MTTTARLSAVLAAILVCNAAFGLPPLEQLLDRAMHANPDIVAARAQTELAKAELNLAQMKVARALVALHTRLAAQTRSIQLIREQLKENPKDRNVMNALINAEAELAEIQSEMSFMIGQPVPGRPAASHPGPAAATPSLPRGPVVDKLSEALGTTVSMEFIETPLKDVAHYLADLVDIPIIVDKSVADIPMTLDLKGVPFAAATQSMEDTCPEISFVVRDYGILVTSSDFAARKGFVSAADFRKHLGGQSQGKKPEPKPQPKREKPKLR